MQHACGVHFFGDLTGAGGGGDICMVAKALTAVARAAATSVARDRSCLFEDVARTSLLKPTAASPDVGAASSRNCSSYVVPLPSALIW